MEFINSYFEVEWIQIEFDENNVEKQIVYKEEFGQFNEALEFYLKKKEEGTFIVRLVSILMESRNEKD